MQLNSIQDKSEETTMQVERSQDKESQSHKASEDGKWHLSSEYWKNDTVDLSTTQIYFPCRDRVNYDILKGHQYEIVENPDRESCRNSRIYICKYGDCRKSFTKTWNLVDHFRIHTKEKPFECEVCKKKFSQKCNLKRHIKLNGCLL